jgi:hypothetical protein
MRRILDGDPQPPTISDAISYRETGAQTTKEPDRYFSNGANAKTSVNAGLLC